ncbi:MAG: hypothetical protein LBD94_00060 [Rickettsiales bacterium]|jgi:hypothetical protein|nr:hypothetical protein [Rickettsiales bacterium]
MKKIYFLSLVSGLFTSAVHAIAPCAVCTVGIAAGLEAARLLGVDDVITGVWAGALTLLLVFWTLRWLKRRNITSGWWYTAVFAVYYALLFGVYYFVDYVRWLWIFDRFLVGAVVGTAAVWITEIQLNKSIAANGGKSRFKFQKVIVPMAVLLAISGIFALIVY